MTYKGQEIAATFVVGADLGRADFTSIQAAVDALPAAGGEVFLREGTYNLSVTVTLPAGKKIKIRGAGDSTVINLGTNAIPAFSGAGGSTVQTYEFESFRLDGANAGGQIVFVSANDGTTYTDWKNVNFGTPDLGGEVGVIEKGIRNASLAGTIIATMVDCRWILASTAAARHFDSASGQNIYVTMTGCEMFTDSGSPGGGANVGVTLFASNCRLKFDGAASFNDLRLMDCRVEGTPAGGISIGSAVFAPPAVQGCSFSRGTSPTRWIDVPTSVDGAVIVGNNFGLFTSEAVRIGATTAVIADNKNCKVTENGTSQANRYSGNTVFAGSTFGTTSTSSALGQDIGCKVTKAAAQSIPNNANTALVFDTERYDTDTMHDNVTSNTRITFNKAGKYLVTANAAWASNATGRRVIEIRKNGVTSVAIQEWDTSQASGTIMLVSLVDSFAKGDFVEIFVFQNSGAALNITKAADYTPEFSAQLIG